MNRENLESSWGDISDKLRNRFPKLTSLDIIYVKGQEEDLLKRIEFKLKKTRLEVLTLIGTL
jgi:hypothetical protein